MVDEKWLTGTNKENAMNYLYRKNVKYLLNDQILDDRAKEINEQAYQAAEINDPQAYAQLRMTEFSQALKKKYNLDAKANDLDVFNTFVSNLWEEWVNLAGKYLAGEDMSLWTEAWLNEYDMSDTIQWGIKWRIADEWSNTKEWSILPNAWELINPIGYITETLDNLWQKWADYITVWKRERENLINAINNLSEEDLQQYRKWYENSNYNGSFEDYIIDTNKTRWQDLVGADEELKWIATPNAFKFFGNMPASTLRLVTASFKNATNPVDSMFWLWKMLGSKEWREALYNRYLTAEWWANAMNYDSVGTADEILSVTNSLWSLMENAGKLTNIKWLENAGNWVSKNIWSPFDVAVEKWLYGGDITYWTKKDNMKTTNVKWLYWAMDDLAWNNALLKGINRYAQDTSSLSKLTENAKSDLNAIKEKANTWADTIIQNNNRMTKKQQADFKKMIWEDQWKWMNDRNLRTQEDLVDYFLKSKNKVDDAIAKIEWQFTSKELTTVLDDAVDFAKKTENKDLSKLEKLQTKNANWWLTMSEINEVKRFYEKNNKFNYLKEWTAEKSALATNRDSALREWQQKVAAENWLTNLKELNKEIQAAKYLTNNAIDWQSGIKWNNPISLTDWIVFAWDWINKWSLEWLVSKKIFTSPWFQDKIVDVLKYIWWRETKWEINADINAINLKNNEKRILAEELAKVKNEKEFNDWLAKAEYMAWPALPYNEWFNWTPTTTITTTPEWVSFRQWQIAEIPNNNGFQK